MAPSRGSKGSLFLLFSDLGLEFEPLVVLKKDVEDPFSLHNPLLFVVLSIYSTRAIDDVHTP